MSFRKGFALLSVIRLGIQRFKDVDNDLKVRFESGDADKLTDELIEAREHAKILTRDITRLVQMLLDERERG